MIKSLSFYREHRESKTKQMSAKTKHRVSYKTGDVILRSEPFAHAVNEDLLQEVCSWCLRKNKRQWRKGYFTQEVQRL